MIFDEFLNKEAGCWAFEPEEGKFEKGKKAKGKGIIKYLEGSVYYGDVYYDGENFNKLGYGMQDFMNSGIRYDLKKFSVQRALYKGEYDYRQTDWIYGKGVMYYLDNEGKPLAHVKGFYRGLEKIAEAEIPEEDILPEFRNTPTSILSFSFENYIGNHVNPDYMLIGDSYFDLFDSPDFAGKYILKNLNKDILNLGVCGYTYSEFLPLLDSMKKVQSVNTIYINLGFNDIHRGLKKEEVMEQAITTLNFLKENFKNSKIKVLSVIPSPSHPDYLKEETGYNELLKDYAEKHDIEFIDMRKDMEEADKAFGAFHADLIHPNENGYYRYAKKLFDYED